MTKVIRRRNRSSNSLSRTGTPNTDSSGSPVDNPSGTLIPQSLSTYTPEGNFLFWDRPTFVTLMLF